MLFEFLILLDAGLWQVSLIRSILFYSHEVNRAACECIINEWFCTTFFLFVCVKLPDKCYNQCYNQER